MSHGNRVHEPIKVQYKEWINRTDEPSKISKWIMECSQSEKQIAINNSIASKEFHKSLQR